MSRLFLPLNIKRLDFILLLFLIYTRGDLKKHQTFESVIFK